MDERQGAQASELDTFVNGVKSDGPDHFYSPPKPHQGLYGKALKASQTTKISDDLQKAIQELRSREDSQQADNAVNDSPMAA